MNDPGLYPHYDALADRAGAWTCYGPFADEDGSDGPAGAYSTEPGHPPVVFLTHAPTEPVAYFVAMHELAHIHLDAEDLQLLDAEAEAWLWALNHALIEPTPEVWAHIAMATDTYLASPLDEDGSDEALLELNRYAEERASSSEAPRTGYPVSALQAG